VADDIVTYGRRPPRRDEAFESLFYACYPQLVQTALRLAGDWAVAGRLAQEAFARLWRRRRWIRDPDAAAAYLREAVTRLANSAARNPGAAPGAEQYRPRTDVDGTWREPRRRTEVDEAWREFQRRRQRAGRRGHRWLAIAAAVVLLIAAAAALAGRPPHNGHAGALPPGKAPPGSRQRALPATRNYPAAITARVPVRNVTSMAGDGHDVWAITLSGDLIRINPRTSKVTLSMHVPGVASGGQLAAGGRTLWLDMCRSSGQVRLLGIDPATGRIRTRIAVPGSCGSIAYGLGHLWIVSGVRGGIQILRVNPATRRVDASTGTIHNLVYSFVAGPEGIWYSTGSKLRQVDPSGTRLTGVTVNDSSYQFTLSDAELALGHGAVWALSGDEDVARIDPATGGITAVVSYRSFDPTYAFTGGPFIDVGQDSLWLLADLARTQVLRVSMSTGQPLGRVRIGGSCGQPCSQIYDIAGAVWVPSGNEIVRIDPARLPG
jgi:DNA-directed RNA polymerase specialized sigma24 family protein